jgi:hypothetical protein
MKNIKSLLVDNIGLPYNEQFWFEIKVEGFHTDEPNTLHTLYAKQNYQDGTIYKEEWFNKDRILFGLALDYLKTKYRFNRYKLSFKTYETDHWAEAKNQNHLEYNFVCCTDRVVCNTEDELKEMVWKFKQEHAKRFNICEDVVSTDIG